MILCFLPGPIIDILAHKYSYVIRLWYPSMDVYIFEIVAYAGFGILYLVAMKYVLGRKMRRDILERERQSEQNRA
jgi:hypothetical protein